jgi:cystathionine beta-lyase/cystathionine gamma-synthase
MHGWRPETVAQHLGEECHVLGAVVPPIFQNSTFVHESLERFEAAMEAPPGGPYHYSRVSNPSLDVVERKLAALEKTDRAKVFASGMAAITCAVFSAVQSGDHVVCVDTVYGPTREFLTKFLARFGVETTFVEGDDPQEFFDASRPETSLFYLESPSSVFFKLQDLAAVGKFAQERGITTVIDNTYASPVHQNPALFGIDIVCHTASKYLGGHSDIVAGALCANESRVSAMTHLEYALLGAALGPFQAWLMNRSMRTLHLRLRQAAATADRVAEFLRSRAEVDEVFHVGLPDYPQAELRDRQMTGWGGLLSFVPKFQDKGKVVKFCESTKVFAMGVSWGGHESLVVPLECRPMHWKDPRFVVRLYCGLEHPDDLVEDLTAAFRSV